MKLLVFAHTPPPHHGQSYMVQLMLAGFGGDHRAARKPWDAGISVPVDPSLDIQCYHVNARLSKHLQDIGDLRVGKFVLLIGYALQAIWYRFRYGVTTLYYIPAPGKRSALYRDWLVMLLCRPFFKHLILHWHAAGLAKWLETVVQMRSRSLTYRLMKGVDLSIVLSNYNRADAEKLFSRRIAIVSNGIPDPCPDFDAAVRPRREARFAARRKLLSGQELTPAERAQAGGDPEVVRVVYLAHCTREKGIFDAVNGTVLANQRLAAEGSPLRLRFEAAGNFVDEKEREEFDQLLVRLVSEGRPAAQVNYRGFVSGSQKADLLREADVFCFPTYYPNENQPVNLIEAMAYGLPIVASRWRSIPEVFPAGYEGLVPAQSPVGVAEALLRLMRNESGVGFRETFEHQFTLQQHLRALSAAIHRVTDSTSAAIPEPSPALPRRI